MKKSLRMTTAAAAVAVASTIALCPPASAAASQCAANRACGWYDGNYSGTFGAWSGSTSYLSGFNDAISSMANRRTTQIGWFFNSGYSGERFAQSPGAYGYFSALDYRNDEYSSLFIYSF